MSSIITFTYDSKWNHLIYKALSAPSCEISWCRYILNMITTDGESDNISHVLFKVPVHNPVPPHGCWIVGLLWYSCVWPLDTTMEEYDTHVLYVSDHICLHFICRYTSPLYLIEGKVMHNIVNSYYYTMVTWHHLKGLMVQGWVTTLGEVLPRDLWSTCIRFWITRATFLSCSWFGWNPVPFPSVFYLSSPSPGFPTCISLTWSHSPRPFSHPRLPTLFKSLPFPEDYLAYVSIRQHTSAYVSIRQHVWCG